MDSLIKKKLPITKKRMAAKKSVSQKRFNWQREVKKVNIVGESVSEAVIRERYSDENIH